MVSNCIIVAIFTLFSFVDMSVICADQTLVSDIRAVTCGASVSRILNTTIAQYSPSNVAIMKQN